MVELVIEHLVELLVVELGVELVVELVVAIVLRNLSEHLDFRQRKALISTAAKLSDREEL